MRLCADAPSVSRYGLGVARDPDFVDSDFDPDDRSMTPKEAAFLLVGVSLLVAAIIKQGASALKVALFSGQLGLSISVLAGACIALVVVVGVVRPRGLFGKVFPLLGGVVLTGCVASLVLASA
jgi:hypothetical protein